jgi:tetratricopeptide (TPR) repeat protein
MLAVLARNPENVIARINLGKAYIRLHQPAAAIEQLEQAVLLSPQSGTAKKFLGMAYQVAGRYDEALATLRQLENDPTQDISAGIEIGRTQLLMGQPEEAQHTFRALADRLGNSPTFTHMAELTGRYIEARRALDRKPNDEEARLDLAGAAIDLELPQLAESALRFRPSTPQIAARRHMAQGDEATALAEYEQARPVLGRDPYLRTQLVGLYLGAGRVDEALALAEELIREGHVTSVTYYNQACALARLGRTDEAFTALRRAVNAGYDNLQNLSTDPDLASLCGDERFMEILDLVADRSK